MTQDFVIAFGGTGARCMEALAYLAASRSISGPLHVLVVDPDASNGNVQIAINQLQRYQRIQSQVKSNNKPDRPFFSTRLNEDLGPESFVWENPQGNEQFQTLIGYSAQSPDTKALLELLYDESDLQLSFEKGYIGRAHIGSLDLLRTLQVQIKRASDGIARESAEPDSILSFFIGLREATQQPGGARLLVIGSVFGGTGASGLPAIPPLMRSTLLSGLKANLKIGCVQLAPYFSFPPGRPEDPDSALHPLATQASLFHYSLTDTGYDRIYLIGAPGRDQSNTENVVGGDAQRNLPHYVELGAALASAHFFGVPPTGSGVEVYACGADEVSWDKLPSKASTNVRRNLVAFGTFCAMHVDFLSEDLNESRHSESRWMSELLSARNRSLGGREAEIRDLRDFASRFLEWCKQIQRVNGVSLFDLSARGTPEGLRTIMAGGKSEDPFHEIYHELNITTELDQESGTGWYIHALTRSTDRFCALNYGTWT